VQRQRPTPCPYCSSCGGRAHGSCCGRGFCCGWDCGCGCSSCCALCYGCGCSYGCSCGVACAAAWVRVVTFPCSPVVVSGTCSHHGTEETCPACEEVGRLGGRLVGGAGVVGVLRGPASQANETWGRQVAAEGIVLSPHIMDVVGRKMTATCVARKRTLICSAPHQQPQCTGVVSAYSTYMLWQTATSPAVQTGYQHADQPDHKALSAKQ